MKRSAFFAALLALASGCQTAGHVIGHKDGMEVAPGERQIQYESKEELSNVFINGFLCEKAGHRFLAKVPVRYDHTPMVVTTVTHQGRSVVLESFTLRASHGLPAISPACNNTVFIDSPPDGMVIRAR